MNKLLLIIIVIYFSTVTTGQDFNNYEPLKSSGILPDDFTLRTSVKVAKDISTEISNEDKSKVKKTKSEFLLKSNYMIDELLMSGRVLFGDPVSEYVNKIADKILAYDPKLREDLRFYCVKSNVTNAFTTNQGMIFVTLGLISQLENEAQLAYVLAHEVTHYTKKHVINSYLESDRVFGERGRYKYNSYDDNIVRLSNYSKSLEFESDSSGFFMMEKAGYSIDEAMSVFDVLQFSHLPYDEVEFDVSFLESENLKIPEQFILDSIIQINFEADYDDSKSTHPNVDKRRTKIRKFIAKSGSKNTAKYLISEKEFKNVREICRFEAIRLNLKGREYVRALYNAQLLQKNYPNNIFLQKSTCKALYGIFKYKSEHKYHKIVDSYDEYEGNISSAYYLFEQLNAEQVGSLAIKYIWEVYNKSKDVYIKSLLDDVIKELQVVKDIVFEIYKTKEDLEAAKEKIRQDSIAELEKLSLVKDSVSLVKAEESDENLSKYEKLRKIRQSQEEELMEDIVESVDNGVHEFHLLAFIDANQGELLNEEFNQVSSTLDAERREKEEEDKKYEHLSDYKRRKAEYKDKKKAVKNELKIGAKKVIYVDPEYFVVDERKGVKLVNSEDMKFKFYDQIEEVSAASNLEVDILSAKLFNNNNVDSYNSLAAFNDWVGERMDHDEMIDGWKIIPSETEFVIPVAEELGTELITYSGVIVYKEKKEYVAATLLVTALYFPLLPFGIAYAVSPSYYTYYYTMVYDVNTGAKVVQKMYDIRAKANKGNINSFMYDLMYQMQQQK